MKHTIHWAIIIMITALTIKTAPALAQIPKDPCDKAMDCPRVREVMTTKYRNYFWEWWRPKRPRYDKQTGNGGTAKKMKERNTTQTYENGVRTTETTYENTDSTLYTNVYRDGTSETFWIIPPNDDTSWVTRRIVSPPPVADSTAMDYDQSGTPDTSTYVQDAPKPCDSTEHFFRFLPSMNAKQGGNGKAYDYKLNYVKNREYKREKYTEFKKGMYIREKRVVEFFKKHPGIHRIVFHTNTTHLEKNGVTYIGCDDAELILSNDTMIFFLSEDETGG